MAQHDSPSAARRWNTRLGLILFFVYLLFYAGFVLISAFAPELMERVVWAGLNLAVVYGFALIVVAFAMALVFGFLCRSDNHAEDQS